MEWIKKLFCFHYWVEISTMDWISKYDWPATQTIDFYMLSKGTHKAYECLRCGKLTVQDVNKIMLQPQ